MASIDSWHTSGPADAPQDPDDPEFIAGELRLLTETADMEIELNIDADNLGRNDTPPPDGWIFVLGLEIEVRASDGLTELAVERHDLTHADFEGIVRSVDVDSRDVTLEDGTIVRVIDETEFAFKDGDRHRLPDLSAVAEALAAGDTVFTQARAL